MLKAFIVCTIVFSSVPSWAALSTAKPLLMSSPVLLGLITSSNSNQSTVFWHCSHANYQASRNFIKSAWVSYAALLLSHLAYTSNSVLLFIALIHTCSVSNLLSNPSHLFSFRLHADMCVICSYQLQISTLYIVSPVLQLLPSAYSFASISAILTSAWSSSHCYQITPIVRNKW